MPRRWIKGISKDTRSRPGRSRRADRSEGLIIAIDGEGRPNGDDSFVTPLEVLRKREEISTRFNLSEIEEEGRRAANTLDHVGLLAPIPSRTQFAKYPGGEWDWARDICKAERARLARRHTGKGGMEPDVCAEVLARRLGREISSTSDLEDVMGEWLHLTRLTDAAYLARNRRELGAGYGGATLSNLFTPAEQDWDSWGDEDDELRGQDYFLMVASDAEQVYQRTVSVKVGRLSTEAIFGFLTSLPRDSLIIGYGLNYDVSMWLADLTLAERLELKDRQSRRYGVPDQGQIRFRPYEWRGWQIDRYGSLFKVRRTGTKAWTNVWDVIRCYQKSFLKTLDAWMPDLDADIRKLIEFEKGRRGGVEKDLGEQTAYSTAECWTLAEIHGRFRQVLLDHGIKVRGWHGASVAKAMLKANEVSKHYMARSRVVEPSGASHFEYEDDCPVYQGIDSKAYFGGRFEISAHGPVAGPIYEYDLTSAYPHWERLLPSLAGSRWECAHNRRQVLKHEGWFVGLVSWDVPDDHFWGPFPHRDRGRLSFPREGYKEWVWSPEIRVMEEHFPRSYTLHEAWMLHPGEGRPFAHIEEMYALRAELEAQQKGRGDPLKIGVNSTYGALAERTSDTPHWQSLSWAGMITSGCRSQVLEQLYADPANVLAVATDAIYTREPVAGLAAPVKVLGGWEETRHDTGWFFAQSGIMLPMAPGGKMKSRGYPAKDLGAALGDFLKAWDGAGTDATVKVRVQRFFGFDIGVIRPEYWNHWVTITQQISLGVRPKRRDPFTHEGIVRSLPCHSGGCLDQLGWMFDPPEEPLQRAIFLDQPDWTYG